MLQLTIVKMYIDGTKITIYNACEPFVVVATLLIVLVLIVVMLLFSVFFVPVNINTFSSKLLNGTSFHVFHES